MLPNETPETIPYRDRAIFACIDSVTREGILVREGVKGYWPFDGLAVESFNANHGWTAEEIESAYAASIFGWNVPIANKACAAIERQLRRGAVRYEG